LIIVSALCWQDTNAFISDGKKNRQNLFEILMLYLQIISQGLRKWEINAEVIILDAT
jgi:hypothetical protein